jgi:hypothetical protein
MAEHNMLLDLEVDVKEICERRIEPVFGGN